MHSRMSWDDLWPLLLDGTLDTVYMVGLAALFTVLLGLPVGVVLFISRKTDCCRCRNSTRCWGR